jgi:putative ABC transport system permease protein
MVLGDGAHVRLRVVAILDGSTRNRSLILPGKLLRAHTAGPARPDPPEVDVWITFAVVGVIVAYAALSLINSLVAALTGRRRELALLHLAGATKRQIRRMLEAEALLIGGIGALVGTAVAIAGLIPLAVATAGSPLPSGPAWVFVAVLVTIAALVLLPTLVVTRTTLRTQKVTDVELA